MVNKRKFYFLFFPLSFHVIKVFEQLRTFSGYSFTQKTVSLVAFLFYFAQPDPSSSERLFQLQPRDLVFTTIPAQGCYAIFATLGSQIIETYRDAVLVPQLQNAHS